VICQSPTATTAKGSGAQGCPESVVEADAASATQLCTTLGGKLDRNLEDDHRRALAACGAYTNAVLVLHYLYAPECNLPNMQRNRHTSGSGASRRDGTPRTRPVQTLDAGVRRGSRGPAGVRRPCVLSSSSCSACRSPRRLRAVKQAE
jgi:hypothetical protein